MSNAHSVKLFIIPSASTLFKLLLLYILEIILSSPEAKERSKDKKATRKYSSKPNSAIFCWVTECNRICLAWPAFRIKTSPRIKERLLLAAQRWTGKLWGRFAHDIGQAQTIFVSLSRSKTGQGGIHVTCFPIFFALKLFKFTYVLFYFSTFQRIVDEAAKALFYLARSSTVSFNNEIGFNDFKYLQTR